MKLTGNLRENIRAYAKKHPTRVERAAYMEAQIEVTEMKRRTPVDTRPNAPHPGNLRDSIHVLDPEWNGSKLSVTIATGAQAAEYDLYVHENPDAFHPIGQWKYMESVINELRPFMAQRIANRVHFDKGDA